MAEIAASELLSKIIISAFNLRARPGVNHTLIFGRASHSQKQLVLYGPQKGQVGWRGYLSPKSGSPASILGSPAIYSKKAKRFFFPLFMLVMVLMLFFLFLRLHA